jgi:hypothetical protein
LHENKEADVSVAVGAPLQLVANWQLLNRDPLFAFRMLHQATVGPNSKFAADGVLYSITESKQNVSCIRSFSLNALVASQKIMV